MTGVGRARGKVKLDTGEAQRYPQRSTGSPPGFHLVFQTGVDDLFRPMDAIRSLCGFTDALERLLASADAVAFERAWCEGDLDQVGWEALALGRRATGAGAEAGVRPS